MLTRNVNTELKVGIFTVLGLTAIGVVALTLEGNPFSAKRQEFYTVLDNVSGVGVRTQVRTAGVPVGEVSAVEILPKKGARIVFKVNPDVQIPKGSYLELKTRGLLGDVFLEIVRNETSTEFLKSGDTIPKSLESNDLNALMASLGSIAKDVQTVTRTLSAVFGTQEGQASLQNILRNVEQVTLDTRELVASERRNVSLAIAGFRDTAQRLAAMLERNQGRVDQSLANVADATRDFRAFAAEIRGFVGGENKERIENIIAAIDDSMRNFKETSSKVELIVSKVERGEGSIGQLVSKDDTANELRSTLKSVQDLLRPATALKFELDYKGELRTSKNSNLSSAGNHFAARLSTRPDRYYLLGISDSPAAVKRREITTTTTTQNGNTVTSERELTPEERGRLRFDAQFAKRFGAVGVRFGLFESYAGVAGDLYLFSDRVQTSVEAFNFSDNNEVDERGRKAGPVRLKTYANVFLTPNIYLTGGGDNIVKSSKPLAFFGAGLRFTEDDFKSIVGAAALAR